MIGFLILYGFVICQRLFELRLARKNESALKKKGAIEYGGDHYKWIVALHILFLASLAFEVIVFHKSLSPWFGLPLAIFILSQVLRVWSIASLGSFWNTKIIIIPGVEVVEKGPYAFIRHPNYLIVALEIFSLPLIFQAYVTALLFSLLNGYILLKIRIPEEERSLRELTNYSNSLVGRSFNKIK